MESIEVWITPAILIAGLGFIWKKLEGLDGDIRDVRKDLATLTERMARLEGLFEGFTKRET